MNRLPGYDRYTRSAELALFSSLGLVALVLIGFAVTDATNFAVNRDAIVAAVSGEERAWSKDAATAKTNVAATTTPALGTRWQGEPPGACTQATPM
jgi:hypothetical protein